MKSKLAELRELREKLNISASGLENIKENEVAILVSNHSCLMDIFYVPCVIDKDIISLISSRLMYKNDTLRKNVVNKYLNGFPIEAHGGKVYSQMCLDYSAKLLKDGHILSIFPEGAYIEDDGNIYKGRTGAARILFSSISDEFKPSIIPVSIKIDGEIEELDNYFPTDNDVKINILEPIDYDEEYYNYSNTDNENEKNMCLHHVTETAMRRIASSIGKKYIDKYIELFPKNNVIYQDGETIKTEHAQNVEYVYRYKRELDSIIKNYS
jgi:phospholipid/glycerol acyltransferase